MTMPSLATAVPAQTVPVPTFIPNPSGFPFILPVHASPANPSFVTGQREGGDVKVTPQTVPMTSPSAAVNGVCYRIAHERGQRNEMTTVDEHYKKGLGYNGQGMYACLSFALMCRKRSSDIMDSAAKRYC